MAAIFRSIFVREGAPSGYGDAQHALYVKGPILELREMAELLDDARGQRVLRAAVGREIDGDQADLLAAALTDGSHYPESESVWAMIGAIDEADAQVEIQKLRGAVAKGLGFDAVRTPDEFDGETVMILSSGQIKPAKPSILENVEPVKLDMAAFPGKTLDAKREAARNYAREHFAGSKRVQVTNAHDGRAILIPWSGVKHALSGKVTHAAIAAVRQLETLVERARPIESMSDQKGRNTITGVQRYEVPTSLAGIPVTLQIITRDHPDGTRYYDHFEIKESPSPGEQRVADSDQVVEGPSGASLPPSSALENVEPIAKRAGGHSALESVEPTTSERFIFEKAVNFADKFAKRAPQSIPARFDAAQRAAAEKFATFHPGESFRDRWTKLKSNAADRVAQKLVDQFRPLKTLNMEAFMQAHLSKGTDGALEAVFDHGIPVLHEGAFLVKEREGGFRKVLANLNGEHDQFLMWVVGNRSEKLLGENRERLFTDADIAAMKRLNQGRMHDGTSRAIAYGDAVRQLDRYNRAFLDIAQASGEINAEARKYWEDGFYIPFYREMADNQNFNAGQVKGLVGQKVIERLVGGSEPMGDPLENILANWSQMLTASMKNMAANKALDSAVKMEVASKIDGPEKGSVWTMRDGEQAYWLVHDPAVLEALEALSFTGYDNPLMRAAGKFKHILTAGVTINPSFRIRNMARDVLTSMATADVGYNPIRNIVDGLKLTRKDSDTNIALMAGGGAVRFGAINDGDQASHAKRLIAMGVNDNQILDTQDKLKNAFRRLYDGWAEVGDRTETINRALIYDRLIKQGKSHLEASFEARDLMNFTSMGSSASIRALTQVLPFFNARLQGVDRLVRGAKANPRRFYAVVGTLALVSAALFLANSDDPDYDDLPDYVRDNYWPIKLAGKWLYIPKPFEVGAMASVVERATELAISGGDYQAKDFAKTLLGLISGQLAMNPIPQIARPVMEAAFNYDLFRMAPIDSMGQQNLAPEDRFTARTSAGAIAAGKITGIPPQRMEHMVTGYFGWLGVQALNASDYLLRDAMDLPSNPRRDLSRVNNLFVMGDFFKDAGTMSGKYVNRFYAAQAEIDELYASAMLAAKTGNSERAQDLFANPKLRLRPLYQQGDKQISKINQQIKRISNSTTLSSADKNDQIETLSRLRNSLAERVDQAARAAEE